MCFDLGLKPVIKYCLAYVGSLASNRVDLLGGFIHLQFSFFLCRFYDYIYFLHSRVAPWSEASFIMSGAGTL